MELVGSLMILSLIIAGYWALVTFPKQQAFRKHQRYVRELAVGDRVVTYGGLIGTITELDTDAGEASILLTEHVEVRVITAAITQSYNPDVLALSARVGMKPEEGFRSEV
ncbi:MAG: preprotein translocase subunit YajC [Anaerolineae bacterium]|nr:preprotein translocase subunit YajC [Anaerolineae bacterium]